jgi:hypothetical protein
MLAELAAANAAFAVIKKCVENGSELAKAGKAISDFTLNKDQVQKKAASKGSNLDGSKSDLDEFLALDELKRKEDELRSMMQLYGRAGMYPDYVKFCAEARRSRAEALAAAKRQALKTQDNIILVFYWSFCVLLGLAGLSIIIYLIWKSHNV